MNFKKNVDKQYGMCYNRIDSTESRIRGEESMNRTPQRGGKLTLEATVPKAEINVTALYTTFSYYYTPTFIFHGEWHEAWEFVYAISGEVILETDDQTLVLKPGQAFIHKPNEFHKHRANNVACNACFIAFDADHPKLYDVAGHVLQITQFMQSLIYRITDEGPVYLAGKNYTPPLSENEVVGFGCGQIVKNALELLLIELIRQEEAESIQSATALSRTEKMLILSIKRFLSENLHKKLSLEDIANGLGYSVSHICSAFKRSTNMSIIHYFISLRINKAKELIAEGKMSLGEISDFLEFDTIQYFSTQFKKFVGVPPSQYAAILKSRRLIEADSHTLKLL